MTAKRIALLDVWEGLGMKLELVPRPSHTHRRERESLVSVSDAQGGAYTTTVVPRTSKNGSNVHLVANL